MTDHKELGTEYFNQTWDLLDKADRTPEEELQMIHLAHASRHHWSYVGDETNFARGEWQISRVYSALFLGESALLHGRRALEIAKTASLGLLDLAFGYEAVARAYAVMGDKLRTLEFKTLASSAASGIESKEDREYVMSEIDTIA